MRTARRHGCVERKVYFKAYLAAYSGTGNVAATEDGERDTHAVVELIYASGKGLQLIFAQAAGISDGAIEFCAEREVRGEVVLERKATGVDMASRGLHTEDTGAGVAGEQESEVGVDPALYPKTVPAR